MSRDRFRKLKSCLHFADNNNLGHSKVAKVLPLYDLLNTRLQQFGVFSKPLAIDESMVPYFGRHTAKMFIRGKPIRFGYKIWCMCSPDGYPYRLEIYCGKKCVASDSATSNATSVGERVVMDMLDICEDPSRHEIYFDNFFTSVNLLEKLSDKNIRATGTIRRNRTAKCPLQEEKVFKKKARGEYEFKSTDKVVVVSWNDKRVVNVASNFESCQPVRQCSRYSTQRREKNSVPQPLLIQNYNASMGGVDLLDRMLGSYRPTIKGKKWWWPLWINFLNTIVVAAWRFQQRMNPGQNVSHLDFLREVTMALVKKQTIRTNTSGITAPVALSVRFDSTEHYIASSGRQARCAHCHANTMKCCRKCNRPLHEKCFVVFHTR